MEEVEDAPPDARVDLRQGLRSRRGVPEGGLELPPEPPERRHFGTAWIGDPSQERQGEGQVVRRGRLPEGGETGALEPGEAGRRGAQEMPSAAPRIPQDRGRRGKGRLLEHQRLVGLEPPEVPLDLLGRVDTDRYQVLPRPHGTLQCRRSPLSNPSENRADPEPRTSMGAAWCRTSNEVPAITVSRGVKAPAAE